MRGQTRMLGLRLVGLIHRTTAIIPSRSATPRHRAVTAYNARVEPTVTRDPRAEAVRAYVNDAAYLREQARQARADGYGHWAYEFEGLAVIATRAAKAEVTDPEPRP